MRLVAPGETPVEALRRMDAQLGVFAARFHTELHQLAGGSASHYVAALARASLQAAGGVLALVAVPTAELSAEADRLASLASRLLDAARAAAGWEGVLRAPATRRAQHSSKVQPESPFAPPGGSVVEPPPSKSPTLSELASLVVKNGQASDFLRLLDGVEADERAKAKPSRRVLRRIESARRKVHNRLACRARSIRLVTWHV